MVVFMIPKKRILLPKLILAPVLVAICFTYFCTVANAQPAGNLSLAINPSPFVVNLKPESKTTLEILIRNSGESTEKLKIEPKSYTVDDKGNIKINESTQATVAPWIKFESPEFTVGPGQWFNQLMYLTLPKDTAYNYPFVLKISRVQAADKSSDSQSSKDSVQVSALINVDKPNAKRALQATKFSTPNGSYESLPAQFDITIKNTGNMITSPSAKVYIYQGTKDKDPIATLAVNTENGHILPGNSRSFGAEWTDEAQQTKQMWDWTQIRIGEYTAKLVAVYNDGLRDVTIEKQVTFWVMPWRTISGFVFGLVVSSLALWWLVRKINRKRTQDKKDKA